MKSNINEPVNLGTSDHVSINELVDMITKIEGIKIKKEYQMDKIQGVRARLCDFTKAEKLLRWTRKVTLEKGLKEINIFVHKQLGK